MPIEVVFYWPEDVKKNPFPKSFKNGLCEFVDRLEKITDIPMKVVLKVVPAMLLPNGHKGWAFGLCHYEEDPIIIHVAAHVDADLDTLRDTICHEVVHVEQVRDGRKITERGVKVRARNLVRKVLENSQ